MVVERPNGTVLACAEGRGPAFFEEKVGAAVETKIAEGRKGKRVRPPFVVLVRYERRWKQKAYQPRPNEEAMPARARYGF